MVSVFVCWCYLDRTKDNQGTKDRRMYT